MDIRLHSFQKVKEIQKNTKRGTIKEESILTSEGTEHGANFKKAEKKSEKTKDRQQ